MDKIKLDRMTYNHSSMITINNNDEMIGQLVIDSNTDKISFYGNNKAFKAIVKDYVPLELAVEIIKDECISHEICGNDCKLMNVCDNTRTPECWKL